MSSQLLLLLIVAAAAASADPLSTVHFNLSHVVASDLNGVFEVTLDVGTLTDGTFCNLTDPKVIGLVRGMSYSYIRIGGTEGDFTYYAMNDTNTHFPVAPAPAPFTRRLTAGVWDEFMTFAQAVGAQVLFGLNAGPFVRDAAGAWTPTMAESLIRHNAAKFPGVMGGYEFGNEPDLYPVNFKLYFPNGTQWARDMHVLRAVLNGVDAKLLTLCCDVMYVPLLGALLPIVPEFVAAGGLDATNVSTWHYYPLFGKRMDQYIPQSIDIYFATPERLAMPLTLNEADKWASHMSRDSGPMAEKIWLGETASASFGGQLNVSDSWVDAMASVDKAGLITRLGHQRAFRQEICASHWTTNSDAASESATKTSPAYTLIDADNSPRPTYFAMWLFRRLVGDVAFASASSSDENGLRAYAYSARNASSAGGAVILVLVNPTNETRTTPTFCFAVNNANQSTPHPIGVYELTGCNGELTSKSVCINGQTMSADSAGTVGALPPPWGMTLTAASQEGCFRLSDGTAVGPRSMWFAQLNQI